MDQISAIVSFVAENLWSVLGVFVISIGLGVLAKSLKLTPMLAAAVGKRPLLAIAGATAIGAFSPFCSCTVIPVVAGLLVAGVPLAPVMAFWVASPTMDPEIFTMTVAMLGWPLATARLVATLGLSLAAGLIVHAITRSGAWRQPLRATLLAGGSQLDLGSSELASSGHPAVETRLAAVLRARWDSLKWRDVGTEIARDSWLLGRWLVLAFVTEALILEYVPQDVIASAVGESNAWSVPLAALIGVPLYLGNLAALPIVQGLLGTGMGPGAALAFLVAGPITTMPAMLAVRPLVKGSVFGYYLAVGLVGAVVAGLIGDLVL